VTDTHPGAGAPSLARRPWIVALALALLGLALYLPRLGESGLWDPWEPRYAQAAREMAASDDWVVPRYREGPRLNRPPLTYWLIGAAQAVLGIDEAAARLPSALLAVLGAAGLGLALAARGRPLEGFMAGAALLTSPQWLLLGRFATPALPLAAFLGMALALAVGWPAAEAVRARRLAFVLLVLLVAAAGMTDWPRGLLLPLWAVLGWGALRWGSRGSAALVAVAGIYHAAQLRYDVMLNLAAAALALALAALVLRLHGRVRLPVLFAGAGLVVLLVAPWFLVAQPRAPEEWSLYEYKYAFNLGESEHRHTGPYDHVVRLAAVGGMPWSALAVIGLVAGLRRRRDESACILAGAALGVLLFFTLSEARMGYFYVVAQPAIAGLAGIGAVALMRKLDLSAVPAALALAGTVWILWRAPARLLETATIKFGLFEVDLFVPAVGTALAWLLALAAAKIRGREPWVVASIIPPLLLAAMLGLSVVPRLSPFKSAKPMWELYMARRGADERIGMAGGSLDSAYYYSDNSIVRLDSPEKIRDFVSGGGVSFVIGPLEAMQPSMQEIGGQWETVDLSHPTHRLYRFSPVPTPSLDQP